MKQRLLQSIFLWMAAVMLAFAEEPLVVVAANSPRTSGAAATLAGDTAKGPMEIPDAIEPGYRAMEASAGLVFNPFEPVSEVRSDANSPQALAMLKRIKGYVVQANGAPLLVIDGKSYRIKDKVPLNAGAESIDKKDASAAPVGGDTVTILNITQTEAVFQKDDASGFGGETFKIFFNFKHETDDTGKTNYNVWDVVGNGFFINEDGVIVVPLDIAQGGELSVLTPYGYSKATLVESDSKRGIGLLKVNVKSIPLYLTVRHPEMMEEIFPVGYPVEQKVGLRFLEGFIKEIAPGVLRISPEVDGSLVGGVVLNRKAEVIGMMVGQTGGMSNVVELSPDDAVFRKYAPSKTPSSKHIPSRGTIEQSVVRIFKKK